jgi:hypothetical protein
MCFRLRSFLLSGLVAMTICAASSYGAEATSPPGWQSLFDGKTTNGWHSPRTHGFPQKGWIVESDGSLHHLAKGGGGDLISDRQFTDFELEWDWKIAPGGNSGVKYLVLETRPQVIGHEYQLIDNSANPDGQRGPKWQTAAFYDVLPAHDARPKPPGEWNQSRVLVQGNHVEHWLNGVKVLEYELGSPEVLAAVATSKFKDVKDPGFGMKFTGRLLLQDHGDEVWFRNLRVRELTPR